MIYNELNFKLKTLLKENNLYKKDFKIICIDKRVYSKSAIYTWYACKINDFNSRNFNPEYLKQRKAKK